MPPSKDAVLANPQPMYTVWFPEGTKRGTAKQLMDQIHKSASARSSEARKLSTAEYADAIVADAPYFLAKDLLEFLRHQHFESEYDRALRYLAEMEPSGLRILSKN